MKIHTPEEVGLWQVARDTRYLGILTLAQRQGKVVHLGNYGLIDYQAITA